MPLSGRLPVIAEMQTCAMSASAAVENNHLDTLEDMMIARESALCQANVGQ